jgi:hypothetical protein
MISIVDKATAIKMFSDIFPGEGQRNPGRMAYIRVMCEGGLSRDDAKDFLKSADPHTKNPQNNNRKIEAEVDNIYDHIEKGHHKDDWTDASGRPQKRVNLWGFKKFLQIVGEPHLSEIVKLGGLLGLKRKYTKDHYVPPNFAVTKNGVFYLPTPKKADAPLPSTEPTDAGDTELPKMENSEADGVEVAEDTPENEKPIRISSPIYIKSFTRNTENSDWGLTIEWPDPAGHIHGWTIPRSMLATDGAAIREELSKEGVEISVSKGHRELFLRYLNSAKPETIILSVNRTGWFNNEVYVTPDRVIGRSEEPVVLQTTVPVATAFTSQGTLQDWKTYVARLAVGNPNLLVPTGLGFASVVAALCPFGKAA